MSGTMPTMMRAWAINAYGGPQQLHMTELPLPTPGPRDVLLHMHGAEFGDWDILVREGEWPMERPFPLVLGLAGSGTVAALGHEVTQFKMHDPLYVYSYPLYDNGAWAEYMLVPVSYPARAPNSLELTSAGGVPIVGLTAHETLTDILKVQSGDVVLITAASGGVGHLAVQIASQSGGKVVATASSRNHEFVQSLGAETVIDYTKEDLVEAIHARYPQGVDKALNGVDGEAANQVVRALRPGGHAVDLTGSATIKRNDVRIDLDYVVQANAERLAELARLIDAKRLRVEIQEFLAFEKAPKALELIQAKHVRGKIVLKIA